MWQLAHLFQWLEAAQTMRAYIAHNMDGNKELLADLETIKSKVATTRKLTKKGACLLRKVDEKKEKSQVEAHQLAEKKANMVAKKENAKEETARLRRELQDLRAGFAAQKEDLEADHQKQADDMFFYG